MEKRRTRQKGGTGGSRARAAGDGRLELASAIASRSDGETESVNWSTGTHNCTYQQGSEDRDPISHGGVQNQRSRLLFDSSGEHF